MQSLNTFDMNLLRVFDAVMRERSVQAAADALALTPPAVSNALNRLRQTLGDPLFVRTRHGMVPTHFALELNEPIQAGLAYVRAALARQPDFDPFESTRTFAFLMNDGGVVTFLPSVIQRLSTEAPNVKLIVHERELAEYENALDSGLADIAVGRVKLSKSFHSEIVFTDEQVAIMRRDHPALTRDADGRNRISMEDYLAAPHIDVQPLGMVHNFPEKFLGPDQKRRVAVTITQVIALQRVIPKTDLIATIPHLCINVLCNNGELDWAPLPFEMERNQISLWWHNRENDDPGHRWFRKVVRDGLIDWVSAPHLSPSAPAQDS